MFPYNAVVLCSLIHVACGIDLSFPPYFKFGAATSAYQIEGGWKDDGKGENIWDRHTHVHPELIKDHETGDIAADSFHQWRDDVRIAAEMGLQFYRFSINWPRILPNGFPNKINKLGAKYYSNLIDALLAEGIEPIVTLYHWELPVKIQDMVFFGITLDSKLQWNPHLTYLAGRLSSTVYAVRKVRQFTDVDTGGWTNPLIVKWFGNYARIVYSLYADRVKTWLTINEAISVCDFIYGNGNFAPGIKETEFSPFLCNKHILLAHAEAYRIFDNEFKPKYIGRISLANNFMWVEPATPNDTALAELGRQHSGGRYCHPIFSKNGGWPPSIEKIMLEYSLRNGYTESNLPAFTKEEIEFIKGTGDFIALNYYTTNMIRSAKPGEKIGYWFLEGSPQLNAVLEHPPNTYYGASKILPVYPEGIRHQMKWLQEQYGDVDILITENGFSTTGSQLNDYNRAEFIKKHLEQILLSIKVDNVSVIGYSAWSMIDNFEWLDGYTTKFGLYEVDFNDPKRTRTARKSAHFYGCVIKNRSLDDATRCFDEKINARTKRMQIVNEAHVLTNGGIFLILLLLKFILS